MKRKIECFVEHVNLGLVPLLHTARGLTEIGAEHAWQAQLPIFIVLYPFFNNYKLPYF